MPAYYRGNDKDTMNFTDIKFKSKILAAPMAGYTDYAWRSIAARLGAGAVYSEMISVEGLVRARPKTLRYLENEPHAEPFFIQIFGGRPEPFERVMEKIQRCRFDGIDINMGCPVKKVVCKSGGCSLMRAPKTAEAIILAIRKDYKGPLSVKIRAGWDENSLNAVEMAKMAEQAGTDAITVHPRTRAQGYSGLSDWRFIADVKQAVKIPVIGNGDVHNKEDAERMFKETGCDMVMIGRASIGNPFVFREAAGGDPATIEEKIEIIRELIRLLSEREDRRYTINAIKKFVPKMFRGCRDVKAFSQKIYLSKGMEEALDHIKAFEDLHRDGDRKADHI